MLNKKRIQKKNLLRQIIKKNCYIIRQITAIIISLYGTIKSVVDEQTWTVDTPFEYDIKTAPELIIKW